MRIHFDLGEGIDPETVYAFGEEWIGAIPKEGDFVFYDEKYFIVKRIVWSPGNEDTHIVTVVARKIHYKFTD